MTPRDAKRAARPARRTRAIALGGSVATSALTLLAFPPFDLWPLAFLAPVPLFFAAERAGRHRRSAAMLAAVGAAPLWAWEEQWIFGISPVGYVLVVAYLSLFAGLFLWLASWVASRARVSVWTAGPVLWVALEVLRGGVLWDGYPWLLAAHPLVGWPRLAHAAAAVGTYGVSLLTVAAGAGAWVATAGRVRLRGLGALVGIAAVWAGLSSVPGVEQRNPLRIAVVQTNVPQSIKGEWPAPERVRDLDTMLGMTVEAAGAEPRPELIVWPETMFPGAALDAASLAEEASAQLVWHTGVETPWPALRWVVWRGWDGEGEPAALDGPIERGDRLMVPTTAAADSVFVLQERLGIPLLIGAEGIDGLRLEVADNGAIREESDARYNSTYLVRGGRAEPARYDKMHLTPFGEVMPYISRWQWLESLFLRVGIGASGMAFNLEAGERPVAHEMQAGGGSVRVATPICFEGIMPAVCRRLVYGPEGRRADVLVQLTNEGWFGEFDTGRLQHLQIVRWRAIELGTSLVRAANTGISAGVGPDGRVIDRGLPEGQTNVAGVLRTTVPLCRGSTVYGRTGDIVGWSCLGLTGAVVLVGGIAGRGTSRGARASDIREGDGADPTGEG